MLIICLCMLALSPTASFLSIHICTTNPGIMVEVLCLLLFPYFNVIVIQATKGFFKMQKAKSHMLQVNGMIHLQKQGSPFTDRKQCKISVCIFLFPKKVDTLIQCQKIYTLQSIKMKIYRIHHQSPRTHTSSTNYRIYQYLTIWTYPIMHHDQRPIWAVLPKLQSTKPQ